MGWITPPTHSTGDVLPAGDWNAAMGDLSFIVGTLGTGVVTSETTTNTGYANLTTLGPYVTVTTGGSALVILSGLVENNSSGESSYMSYNITGATAGSPNDQWRLLSVRLPATQPSNRPSSTTEVA